MKHDGENPYMNARGFVPCCKEFWFDLTHPWQMARRMYYGFGEALEDCRRMFGG